MDNQDLIYQLTRAVFNRLGSGSDPAVVEGIVTDVFRIVEPSLNGSKSSQPDQASADRLIISVFGLDHPGIVAAVSSILAEFNCSIIDINQTVVQNKFAMAMIVNARNLRGDISQLKERFRSEGDRLGVRIFVQREDLFNTMHRL
ncbi:MAG TPA: ACT domain-containing protein [Blastocatellia bacterium]|nr:ACT domain-containing protein [Blastocatellia bacterium]